MFKIIFHRSAVKDFDKLPANLKRQISKALENLASNPYSGKTLKGPLAGSRRIRVGDFRIIYDLHETEQIVLIHAIGSRGDIYK